MNSQRIKDVMQVQKVLSRIEKLEKEMQELRRGLYSNRKISAIKPKKGMHKAALDFLKLKDIPDKIDLSSVDLVRKERKHGSSY